MKHLSNIDLNKNELQNAKIQNLVVAPLEPTIGQVYFDTTVNLLGVYNGNIWQYLDSNGSGGGGNSFSTIRGNIDFDFQQETDTVVMTILSPNITTSNFKSFSFIPIETNQTSLDDFYLNGLIFNLESIIDNTSFNIRATAQNNASGIYRINYTINH